MPPIEDDWIHIPHPDREWEHILPQIIPRKSLDPGLPRKNPTKSAWLDPPCSLANFRSTENLPAGILDVVIIGSGFSGTSVAWHILHGEESPRRKYLSVLMLEARDVCSGATGRNGTP